MEERERADLMEQLHLLEGAKADPLWAALRAYLRDQEAQVLSQLLKHVASADLAQASRLLGQREQLTMLLNLPEFLAANIRLKLKSPGGPK